MRVLLVCSLRFLRIFEAKMAIQTWVTICIEAVALFAGRKCSAEEAEAAGMCRVKRETAQRKFAAMYQ